MAKLTSQNCFGVSLSSHTGNSPAPSSHLENDNDVQGSGSCTSLTVDPLASSDHKGSQDGDDMATEINIGQSPEIHKSNSETTLTMSQGRLVNSCYNL